MARRDWLGPWAILMTSLAVNRRSLRRAASSPNRLKLRLRMSLSVDMIRKIRKSRSGKMMESDHHAGAAYSEFIDEQLVEERSTKSSLESRGLAVITSSATLVTLLLGVATFASKLGGESHLPLSAIILIVVGLATFSLAGAAGVFCNAPRHYGEADGDSLAELLSREHWTSDRVNAELTAATARHEILVDARGKNSCKATWLLVGFGAEVLSVVALGCAIALILTN